jgi:hypothetical protein
VINLGSILDIVLQRPRGMSTAPRDGTAILVLLRYPTNYCEWREACWNPFDGVWCATEQIFTEDQARRWLPAPPHPIPASVQTSAPTP